MPLVILNSHASWYQAFVTGAVISSCHCLAHWLLWLLPTRSSCFSASAPGLADTPAQKADHPDIPGADHCPLQMAPRAEAMLTAGDPIKNARAILRYALPIDNKPIRQIQKDLESISAALRIPGTSLPNIPDRPC